MSVAVGSVHIDVLPSARGFVAKMVEQMGLKDADKVGREIGERIGKEASRGVGEGIRDGVDNADSSRAAAKQGEKTASAFARTFRARIESALTNIPDIEIDADDSPARRTLAELRARIVAFSKINDVSLRLNSTAISAELKRVQEELAAVSKDKTAAVDVRLDAKEAEAELAAFVAQIESLDPKIKPNIGAFAETLKAQIAGVLHDLPDIRLDADISPARARLNELRDEVKQFSNIPDVALHINSAAALAEAERLSAELDAIVHDTTAEIDVRFNARRARAQLSSFIEEVRSLDPPEVVVEVKPELGSFRRQLAANVEAIRSTLPDIEVGVDTTLDERKIAKLKAQLATLGEQINLGLADDEALRKLERFRAELTTLSNRRINLELDSDVSTALEQIRAAITEAGRRDGDAFGSSFKNSLRAAFANLPDVRLRADPTQAERALGQIRAELNSLTNKTIGVDLDAGAAVAKVEALQARLQDIADNATNIQVRVDAAAALAELQAFLAKARGEKVQLGVDANLGEFFSKVKAEIAKASATLPDIKIEADTSPAFREVAALKTTLDGITANIRYDSDPSKVLADIEAVRVAAEALALQNPDVRIDGNIKPLLAAIAEAKLALAGLGSEGERAGNQIAAGISRARLILGLVLALFPVVAAAIVGISSAIALIAAPIGAIVLGLDGIKAAMQPLSAEIDKIKKSTSAAFQQGLQPAVKNLLAVMPALQQVMAGTAAAISKVADQVTKVVASGKGLADFKAGFLDLNVVIESLGPALAKFTENFLALTRIGAQGLAGFGAELKTVADDFGAMIDRLDQSGTAREAVQALFQVLSSIVGLIGPLTELGSVLFAAFGPALATALDGVGVAIHLFASAIDSLPGPLQNIVAIVTTLGIIFLAFRTQLTAAGASLAAFGSRITSGLSTALLALRLQLISLGEAFALTRAQIAATSFSALAAPIALLVTSFRALGLAIVAVGRALLANPLTLIIVGITTALSFLGQANADAAAKETEHKQAVQELASALRDSAGAVDANILALTQKKLADEGAVDAAKQLGLSQAEVAAAIAQGGPAYDALHEKVKAAADAQLGLASGGTAARDSFQATKGAGSTLLPVIEELRQQFVDAAAENRVFAAVLFQTGASLVNGVGNAKQLQSAMATLKNEASSTSDKIKALKDALDALNGGTLTAEEAAIKMQDAISQLGDAFDKAKGAALKGKDGILDASGSFNIASEKGRDLAKAALEVRDGMLASATAAFDAAGGLNNIQGASAAAAAQVQIARDSFINSAKAAGIGADAAAKLADHYGLIPKLVTTLLEAKGLPQVNAELTGLANLINNQVPGTKTVTVTALSDTARQILTDLGVQVRTLPDGTVAVDIDDKTGPALSNILSFIQTQNPQLPVTANTDPVKAAIDAQIADLQKAKAELPINARLQRQEIDAEIATLKQQKTDIPVGADTSQIPPAVDAAKSQVAQDPLRIVTQADTTQVPPAVDAAKSQVASGAAAQLPVAGNVDQVNSDVNAVKAQVQATQANLPIVLSVSGEITGVEQALAFARARIEGSSFQLHVTGETGQLDAAIATARSTAVAPINIPVNATDNASAAIAGIRSTAASPVQFAVSVIDNATGALNGIRTLAGTAITFTVGIVDNATGPINGIRTLAATEVHFTLTADVAAAQFTIDALRARAAQPVSFTVTAIANTSAAESAIANLTKPRTVTITANVVGGVPNAVGNLLPAGFGFAGGGTFRPGSQAKAMRANWASIVPPRTYRVIGDRSRDDEAYIPINTSARSTALLGITAGRMGYGLVPMASGGIFGLAESILRLVESSPSLPSTQSTGTFADARQRLAAARQQVQDGLAGGGKTVEQKLDELIAAVQANRATPSSITVEDRSGDPVETARAVQLAIRLAR